VCGFFCRDRFALPGMISNLSATPALSYHRGTRGQTELRFPLGAQPHTEPVEVCGFFCGTGLPFRV
jgi:hypothetical protein